MDEMKLTDTRHVDLYRVLATDEPCTMAKLNPNGQVQAVMSWSDLAAIKEACDRQLKERVLTVECNRRVRLSKQFEKALRSEPVISLQERYKTISPLQAVAMETGLLKSRLSRILMGEAEPTIYELSKVAKACGVNMEYFVDA